MDRENQVLGFSKPHPGVLQLTLNRQSVLNAINFTLMQQLQEALVMARTDASVRAVLIAGEGRSFCAGADIRELAALDGQSGLAFARMGQQVFRSLEILGKPSLAVIQGA